MAVASRRMRPLQARDETLYHPPTGLSILTHRLAPTRPLLAGKHQEAGSLACGNLAVEITSLSHDKLTPPIA
ncbi:hypothetical protein TKWG_09340 [Advenella kashmirensis WT001]|uniref:Uncharacterized protein n=1 Tax=Advenella kashmirensis (strain DSM 17095 / LMG 22695 / WT001) TaxID=1036672 RepID=I3UB06_ADVKW|nr:hypothetical protein TKWG_09340 [Advenella kashmirensis WT001]